MFRTRALASTLTFFLIASALATNEYPDYPLRNPSEFAVNQTKGEISIGVQPVEDVGEQKTYFNTDVAHLGFVPVFVVIHNGSNEDSFLLEKSQIRCGPDESEFHTPKSGSKAGQALGESAIPFVGLFSGLKVVRTASEIQQNLLRKELQSTTLSPGASTHGFLYVPIPEHGPRPKTRLLVPVNKPGADDKNVFEFVF